MVDKEIFKKGIVLIEIATNKEFTDKQLEIYKMLLEDISDENFVNGVKELLKNRVYSNLPQPAEIREYCLNLKTEDLTIRTETAIRKIKQAISSVGIYRDVTFDDPIIHLLIRAFGGWTEICKAYADDLDNWFKFEVPKLYKAYATRKSDDIPTGFIGIGGIREPNVIGNTEQADKWRIAYLEKFGDVQRTNGVLSLNKNS